MLLSSTATTASAQYIGTLLHHRQADKLPVRSVHCIYQDREGYMWYGTVDGLCRDDGYEVQVIRNDFSHPRPMQSNLIWSIGEDSVGNILYNTPTGDYRLRRSDCHIEPLPADQHPRHTDAPPTIGGRTWTTRDFPGAYQVLADESGHRLWVTTAEDIAAYDVTPDGQSHRIDLTQHLLGYTPDHKMLSRMTRASDGSIWIAGYDRESLIISFEHNGYTRHDLPAIGQRYDRKTVVMTLARAADSLYWIAQEREGLGLYDERHDRLTSWTDCRSTASAQLGVVHELIPSRQPHQIWALTDRPLVYGVAMRDGQMELRHTIQLPRRVVPKTLCEDHTGRLWIGTHQGLYAYDSAKDSLWAADAELGHVTSITEAPDGTLWAAVTGRGVAAIREGIVANVLPLAQDLLSIACSSDGTLWVGTGTGQLLRLRQGEWSDCSDLSGMNGDMVEKIVADAYNHLWILTNRRLTEWDPATGTYRVTNADMAGRDLSLSRFMPRAIVRDPAAGDILVGGFGGFLTFVPSLQIEGMARQVTVHLSDIKIQGHSLLFDLSRPLNEALPADARNIEACFSTLDHLHTHIERYAYRLDDGEWTYLPTGKNSVLFESLPAGDHRLRLKATDPNGLWSSSETEIVLTRNPHWWETLWARFMYGALAIITIWLVVRYFMLRTRRQEQALWNDSNELLAMRRYAESEMPSPSDAAYTQLDQLLLDKMRQIIMAHLGEANFGVAVLADEMHMSRSTLVRKIKAISGLAPLQYIRNVKMEAACQMLTNRTASVADVAQKLGYSDRDHFSRLFRECMGQTPSEWQQSHQACPDKCSKEALRIDQ